MIALWKKKIIILDYVGKENFRKLKSMIEVMRLDGKSYWVNPHMIESMETNPDLTLTMLSGKKLIVKNSPQEIIDKIISYRKKVGTSWQEVL